MMATRASRTSAHAESRAAGDSNTRGRRDYRPTPAHTSAISSLGFLRAEFIERPRIFRRGGLGLARDEPHRAVGLDLCDFEPGLARFLGDGLERWLARLAGPLHRLDAQGGKNLFPVFGRA